MATPESGLGQGKIAGYLITKPRPRLRLSRGGVATGRDIDDNDDAGGVFLRNASGLFLKGVCNV
jgi:hypothetical protein